MGTKNNPGNFDCYDKADADEPMFVLLARDPKAAKLVRTWAYSRIDTLLEGSKQIGDLHRDLNKVKEALACADAMDSWLIEAPKREAEQKRSDAIKRNRAAAMPQGAVPICDEAAQRETAIREAMSAVAPGPIYSNATVLHNRAVPAINLNDKPFEF